MHHSIGYVVGGTPVIPYPLLGYPTCGGHHWRPVETCSLEALPTPSLLTSSGDH